ncbi:MAG: stage III sporulation protein AE [Paenibacillus sp. RIFOXYA1_FULL_44_5]|nr:MAG: stage III sporulation protein AE [Paenibacillus sp. RIFOXYA1_FULL_44_5]
MKPFLQGRLILFFLAISIMVLGAATAYAASQPEDLMKQQENSLHTDQVDQYWNQLMKEYGGYFPGDRTPSFQHMLAQGEHNGFSLSAVFSAILRYFLHEILLNGKLLASIIILTVFSMILETLQSAFEKKSVSKIAYAITYMVLVLIAMNSFSVAINYAKTSISGMIDFMVAMVPLLLTLLASMGSLASVSVMHPLIVFAVHTTGTLVYAVVFPLLFFSTVLHIVSSLTDKYKVTQLANFMRSASVGLLGVFVTVFLGLISVEGASASITDGITLRTAKYVTGNFVPVVGRMFTDASDTVIGASLLIKNAVGLMGVIIIIFLCAFPAIKILTIAIIYSLAAAVMQPLGNSPIISCLSTIGKNMMYIFAALLAVGLMFFLAITIMITAGNVSVLMR